MPTNLDRVQCLLQPDTFAKVRTLSKHNRRALSAMCSELIEEALKLPRYRQQIEEAEVQIPVRDDPRQFIPQTGVTPKTMRLDKATAVKQESAKPSTMDLAKAAMEEKKEEADVDARLQKMEEMMAQMAEMMMARQ